MKRIKVFGLCFAFTCLLVGCQSTSIRPEVERIIQRIGRSYTPGRVGYEGRLTHQDKFIDALEQVATVDELYQIAASDSVPMARYAAFIALLKKRPDMAKNLALLDIQNQSLVPALYGCDSYMESLANLRIEILQQEGRQYGLTKADSVAIDSCVLFTPHAKSLGYLTQLLVKLPPHPQYYQRVKALFLNDHYIEALVTLARYRKPEDVQYVLNALHGRVESPIDVEAYRADYERIYAPSTTIWEKIQRWIHPENQSVEPYRWFDMLDDIHARWKYIPEDDNYNNRESVREYALQCVVENPDVPAYKPYLKAAKAYNNR